MYFKKKLPQELSCGSKFFVRGGRLLRAFSVRVSSFQEI